RRRFWPCWYRFVAMPSAVTVFPSWEASPQPTFLRLILTTSQLPCSTKSARAVCTLPNNFSSGHGFHNSQDRFCPLQSMSFSLRNVAVACLVLATLGIPAPLALGKKNQKILSEMEARKRALHALNRLTFGPRPGDLDRVMAMGVDKWVDQQLHPEKIEDDAVTTRLAPLRTLRMDTHEIVENFPPPQMIKAIADGKQSLPSDPTQRAIYEAQLARYQAKAERKLQVANNPSGQDAATQADATNDEQRERRRAERIVSDQKAEELLDMPPDQRIKEILKLTPEEQRSLTASLKGKRDEVMQGMNPKQRETLMALNNPQQV